MGYPLSGSEPTGAYSPGMVASGRAVFVSGQGPIIDGRIVNGSVAEETELTLRNLQSVLELAGAGLEDVVKVNVYLADIGDFEAMDAAYRAFFTGVTLPTRTTVGAALLGIKVEIDCVAMIE